MDQLRDLGIEVDSLDVRNQHQLNRAFPGAARHWRLTTWPRNYLLILLWMSVLAVVFFLLIGFGVIN